MGEIKDPRAVESLIGAMNERHSSGADDLAAGKALAKIGTPAVDPLIAALRDGPNPNGRQFAAYALGEIKDLRAVEPLIAAMNDPNAHVQFEAFYALVKIGTPTVEPLIAALKDKDDRVRTRAGRRCWPKSKIRVW